MTTDLNDLSAFVAVGRAGGFRDAARASGASASTLSEAVRRLETRLGVRLLNRTTRSIAPTEAGARLLERGVVARVSAIESRLSAVEQRVGTGSDTGDLDQQIEHRLQRIFLAQLGDLAQRFALQRLQARLLE